MSVWESSKTTTILNQLDKLANLLDLNNKQNFGNYYFRSQLPRYYYTLQIILQNINKGKILDIGSYPGHIQKILLELGYDVTGVDIKPERLSDELSSCKDRTIVWDIENDKLPPNAESSFDTVLMFEVIEHLHVNPLNLLKELDNIVVKGGKILLSTPNLLYLPNRINMLLGREVFEHPLSVYEMLDRHGSRGHQRLYTLNELIDLLEVYGFTIEKTWCIDNKPPYLTKKNYLEGLKSDLSEDIFNKFWRESRSWKGKIRRSIEISLNPFFKNYYENIYLLARKTSEFNEELFFERIKKSDPWADMDKYKLDI